MSPLYWEEAARTPEQLAKMQDLEAKGICIFCPESYAQNHDKPMLLVSDYWYVTENDYPYEGSKIHLLIIPCQHVAAFDELPAEAGRELFELLAELKRRFSLPAEALVGRSGDMRRNGGSVEHLHLHYIVGDTDDPDHKGIRFKVSSRLTDKSKPPDR